MLLTKTGTIVEDTFHYLDHDEPIPADGAIIVPAARFLRDPLPFVSRKGPLGIAWSNDRRVQELEPYLSRLALIALAFPTFRDGRAYSQARQLREHLHFGGELRATGDVLRDQFLFLLRAGFDTFEPRKEADVNFFAEAARRYSIFYQPTGDQRLTAAAARQSPKSEEGGSSVHALNVSLEYARPEQILEKGIQAVPRGKLAIVSSFGIESAVLLHLVATLDRSLPVIFLDTGWLFAETLAYRDQLVAHLGLSDVRAIPPKPQALLTEDPDGDLWSRASESCCRLRKVEPLAEALVAFDGWVTGRKRFHGGERARLPVVEQDGPRLKFNPFAGATQKEIAARFRIANLPPHPLAAAGYFSVGCLPCSSPARHGEGIRDGRWRGTPQTECGIHRLAR